MANTHSTLTSLFSDIADSIRGKTGGTNSIVADNFPSAIDAIPTGGGGDELPEHGVFFIDYDGSIVTAWTSDEVASKSALPDNPAHTGLIAQGWNWTLAQIQSYITSYPNADVWVGQMYKTASGLTEIDITITKAMNLTVTCKMDGNKNWGDGTTNSATTHTYTNYGDYMITCDGSTIPTGYSYGGGLFNSSNSNPDYFCTAIRFGQNITKLDHYVLPYCYALKSITIPKEVTTINTYVFQYCDALNSITIPDGVTSIKKSAFYNCLNLNSIAIPDGVTSIGEDAFNACYALNSITIPDGVTSISKNTFNACYALNSITIPDEVTSIDTYAFSRNIYVTKYDFAHVAIVPSLLNVNAFGEIRKACKIIVPDALYNDWIVATNWATYANYIYKASEVTE